MICGAGHANVVVDVVTEAIMAVGVKEWRHTCHEGISILSLVDAGLVGINEFDVTSSPTAKNTSDSQI